jgi:hypothetical protein
MQISKLRADLHSSATLLVGLKKYPRCGERLLYMHILHASSTTVPPGKIPPNQTSIASARTPTIHRRPVRKFTQIRQANSPPVIDSSTRHLGISHGINWIEWILMHRQGIAGWGRRESNPRERAKWERARSKRNGRWKRRGRQNDKQGNRPWDHESTVDLAGCRVRRKDSQLF